MLVEKGVLLGVPFLSYYNFYSKNIFIKHEINKLNKSKNTIIKNSFPFGFLKESLDIKFKRIVKFNITKKVLQDNNFISKILINKYTHHQLWLTKGKSSIFLSFGTTIHENENMFMLNSKQGVHLNKYVNIFENTSIIQNKRFFTEDLSKESINLTKKLYKDLYFKENHLNYILKESTKHYNEFYNCMQMPFKGHCYETLFIKCSNNFDLIIQIYNTFHGG